VEDGFISEFCEAYTWTLSMTAGSGLGLGLLGSRESIRVAALQYYIWAVR